MRYQGRIKTWKQDKGFGFIAPNGGGADVFVHISALDFRSASPPQGTLVTYELATDERGRRQAIGVKLVNAAQEPRRHGSRWSAAAMLVLLSAIGYGAYRITQDERAVPVMHQRAPETGAAIEEHGFKCSPEKNSCSRMTSCAEARFHMYRCGVQGMDGDNDGIPCEQQWCN
jgi:cold shock CspA family protein